MKKTLVTVAQAAVTLAILAWLFRNPESNRKMLEALGQAHGLWIAASVVTFAMVEFLAVIRWQTLLRVQEVSIGWMRLTALMMIGLFFNVFMPGGTGGDVVKIFYLLKETPEKKAAALLAVLMDRIVGLLGLILIAGAVIAARYQWLTQTPATSGLLYALLIIFGGAFGFVGVTYLITSLGLVQKLPQRLPLREKLVEISVAYTLYGRAWRSTLFALLVSIPVHCFSFLQFYCAARAFEGVAEKISAWDFMAIMPIVNTLAAMPISIGGVGVREGLFIPLLGDLCGVATEMATIISLTGYLVIVFWGLLGGLIYIFYRPSAHAKLRRMEREVSTLEHKIVEAEQPPGTPGEAFGRQD